MMTDCVYPHNNPMRGTRGRDARQMVVMRCEYRNFDGVQQLTMIRAAVGGKEMSWTARFRFWDDMWRLGNVLLVVGHPDRDLALAGLPRDGRWRRPPLQHDPESPHFFLGHMTRTTNAQKRITVVSVGNWHPLGARSHELGFSELVSWTERYLAMLRDHNLGRVAPSTASQAMSSLRRWLYDHPEEPTLWYHDIPAATELEYRALKAQSPMRIQPKAAHYDKLYHLDFRAFYLSILASEQLPQRLVAYYPDGGLPDILSPEFNGALMSVADVTTRGGDRMILTTNQLADVDIATVHEAALYRGGRVLAGWAQHLFETRLAQTDPEMETMAKAIGVSLWGKLSSRNRAERTVDHEYSLGDDDVADFHAAHGVATTAEDGSMFRLERDGDDYVRHETVPWLHKPNTFFALGAHVLALGRQRMQAVLDADGGAVVYAHTDSIWSRTPILPGGHNYSYENVLGGVKMDVVDDVMFNENQRFVGGVIEAGEVHRGGRYAPYTASLPGIALWE